MKQKKRPKTKKKKTLADVPSRNRKEKRPKKKEKERPKKQVKQKKTNRKRKRPESEKKKQRPQIKRGKTKNTNTRKAKTKNLGKKQASKPKYTYFFRKAEHELRDFIIVLVLTLMVTLLVSQLFWQISSVDGYSMIPTLRDGDTVLVKKTDSVRRLDMVIFQRGSVQQIRRVIGVPGDRIEYKDDVLYVNDNIISEPYIIDQINEAQKNGGQFTEDFRLQNFISDPIVPENCYFVLGDNREWASDSREYGLITNEQIIGVIQIQLLPVNDFSVF